MCFIWFIQATCRSQVRNTTKIQDLTSGCDRARTINYRVKTMRCSMERCGVEISQIINPDRTNTGVGV